MRKIMGLLSLRGRIGRKALFRTSTACLIVDVVAASLLFTSPWSNEEFRAGLPVVVAVLVASTWVWLAAYAKRLHDQGLSMGWLLLCLFPPAALVVLLGCQLVPGTAGPNRYGEAPES